jgi:DNA primase
MLIRFYTEEQGEEVGELLKYLEKQQKEELVAPLSTIVFDYERYALHQWERKNIYPKDRSDQIAQQVSETILSLRSYWVQQHLEELQKKSAEENEEVLEEVMDYLMLNKVLSKRLNRVLTL